MPIHVRNIRFIQKTGKGHLLETKIDSQNISQLDSDIHQYLKKHKLQANSTVRKDSMTIKNIRNEEGKKAPSRVYAKVRQVIATGLENRNMKATVVGSSG